LISWRTFTHWEVWAAGISTIVLISFQYTGLTMTTASVGGLIIGSNIIFVAPISAIVFGEAFGRNRAVGVVLGLLGIFTISTDWNLASLTSGEMTGNILLVVASLCIALSYPINRLATRKICFEEWVAAYHLIVPIPLLLLALSDGDLGAAGESAVPAILMVGALCTAVPTMLWAKGLESLTFVTSATILLSESVFAVILGVVVLGDPVTALTMAGALMVFTAIFLVSYKSKKKTERVEVQNE